MNNLPLVLIILDGWGYREEKQNNAIAQAKTPFFDYLWKKYPHCLLNASEHYVGLTRKTIGNSEIGHLTIGAGKVIDTDLVRISKAAKQGEFSKNPAFNSLFAHVKKHNSALHVLGMIGKAGVHSHQDHLHEFLKAAKKAKIKKVFIHAFTDGRDTPPQSAHKDFLELEKFIKKLGIGHIATAVGRYFAMDRDNNWFRTKIAEETLINSKGHIVSKQSPTSRIKELYAKDVIDELLEPQIFLDEKGNSNSIKKNDGVFFFNYRRDRTRQLSKLLAKRSKKQNFYFVTMTEYDPDIESEAAFAQARPGTTLAAEISRNGFSQAHIAETEKYPHVTYFFNGGRQEPYPNEKDFLISSRKDVKTHDEAPEMKAKEIADKALEELGKNDFLLLNFANADMVGHTANKPAIIKAVQILDNHLKRVVKAALLKKGIAVITADHGNAETNIDPKTGVKHTAHTINSVPFIIASPKSLKLKKTGGLADIAPTILKLLNLKKPAVMTGKSLIK
jgi:2,3-bisphosphoglycerate-independent phosphoglycerate mutase